MRHVLDDHVDVDARIGERREDRRDRSGLIEHRGQRDLRIVLVVRDPGDQLLFHLIQFLFADDQRAALPAPVLLQNRPQHLNPPLSLPRPPPPPPPPPLPPPPT